MLPAGIYEESGYMAESVKISVQPNPNGDWPKIAQRAYVDPTAQIIGNVHIGPEVLIGPNAIIRADESDDGGGSATY